VTSRDIQPSQAAKLSASLRPPLQYLNKLRRRMELSGFPPSDPLYVATSRAFEALQDLLVRAHYLSCAHGVGK
jgi:hypothetical protein